jgi:hypothetical protein
MKKFGLVSLVSIFILATGEVLWGWGPGGYWTGGRWGGAPWRYARNYNYNATYPSPCLQIQGTIQQVKALPGPGRRGYSWNVIDVKDNSGKVYTFAIGPAWWSVPPDLKSGIQVKVAGFIPPGWAFRGVPYYMLCSITILPGNKTYTLRPCGWWGSGKK